MMLVFIGGTGYFRIMKSGVKALMWATVGIAAFSMAQWRTVSAVDDSPYRMISARNIFDLQDPPPPPPPPVVTPPKPNVKLVGLMNIGQLQAVIWSQAPGTPPPQPVTTVMAAGQRAGSVEVLEIDGPGKSAKVQIDGIDIINLKLEDKPVGAGAQVAVGAGGLMRPALPTAAPAPAYNPAATSPTIIRKPGTTYPGAFNAPPGAVGGGAVYSPTGASINLGNSGLPSRPVRTDAATTDYPTPEEQMIMIEAQRDAAIKAHDPIATILPPTPLGALLNQVPGSGSTSPAPPAPPAPPRR